jgi:hypothetical protein
LFTTLASVTTELPLKLIGIRTFSTDNLLLKSDQSPLSNLLSSQNVQLHIPSSVDIINSLTASPKRRQLPVLQQDNEHRKVTVSKIVDSTEKLTKVKPSPIKPKKPNLN